MRRKALLQLMTWVHIGKHSGRRGVPSADNSPMDSPRQDKPTKRDADWTGHSTKVRCEKSWCSGNLMRSFNGSGARCHHPLRWRCRHWRLQTRTNSAFSVEECENADWQLFKAMMWSHHCLHKLLPSVRYTSGRNMRERSHYFQLPIAKMKFFKNIFIVRCLYNYV